MRMSLVSQRPFVPGLWHGRPTTPEQSDETDEDSDDAVGIDATCDDSDKELNEPQDRGFRVRACPSCSLNHLHEIMANFAVACFLQIDDKVWVRIRKTWYNGIVRQITSPDKTKVGPLAMILLNHSSRLT